MKLLLKNLLFSTLIISIVACSSAKIDKSSVQATKKRPESTKVVELKIPYDPKSPRFLVAVEPFRISNNLQVKTNINGANICQKVNCSYSTGIQRFGNDMSAKLVTVLSKSKNFALIDYQAIEDEKLVHIGKNERGPFIIRGTLTELTEAAEVSKKSSGASFGWLGIVTTIAGVVTDKPGLTWSGAGLTGLNPSYKNNDYVKTGIIAFDIQLIDSNSNRIITADRVTGSFTSVSKESGYSILGISNKNEEFAKSALAQATRVALNDAVQKIWDGVRGNLI